MGPKSSNLLAAGPDPGGIVPWGDATLNIPLGSGWRRVAIFGDRYKKKKKVPKTGFLT